VQLLGEPRRVVAGYRQDVAENEGREHREAKEEREREDVGALAEPEASEASGEVLRWGSGAAEILAVRLLDAAGVERYHFESGEAVTFELEAEAGEPIADVVFGVGHPAAQRRGLRRQYRHRRLGERALCGREGGGSNARACVSPGEYLVDVAAHAQAGAPYDRRLLACSVTSAPAANYLPGAPLAFEDTAGAVAFRRKRDERPTPERRTSTSRSATRSSGLLNACVSPTRAKSSSSTSSTWCRKAVTAAVTSPGHLKRIVQALAQNLARYEEAFGLIPEAADPSGGRKVH
jgi:hypothetical protein